MLETLNTKKLDLKILLKFIYIIFIIITITNCEYQPYSITELPNCNIRNVFIYSYDYSTQLINDIRDEFCKKNIKSFKIYKNTIRKFPALVISNLLQNEKISSIFKDGKIAEYQIILNIYGYVNLLNKEPIPIKVIINSSLLCNSTIKLSRYVKKDTLIRIMYCSAAEKLVDKFLLLYCNNSYY